MKAIFGKVGQNVSNYNAETRGWNFLGTATTEKEFYNRIQNWEDRDFFEQEDGTVTNQNGEEIFNPESPDTFNFFDYEYHLVDVEDLNEDQIRAVANSSDIDAEDIMKVNAAYDVVFNDDENSNNFGAKFNFNEAIDWIKTYNGSNHSYFADYKGGTVSVVNVYTEEVAYETEIK